MSPAEQRQAALFDSYQAPLANDPAALPPAGLDGGLATVARELRWALQVPAPDTAFFDRLEQQLGLAPSTVSPRQDARGPRGWRARPGRRLGRAGVDDSRSSGGSGVGRGKPGRGSGPA